MFGRCQRGSASAGEAALPVNSNRKMNSHKVGLLGLAEQLVDASKASSAIPHHWPDRIIHDSRVKGPEISYVMPPEARPNGPRWELKYSRLLSGENAGPVTSER